MPHLRIFAFCTLLLVAASSWPECAEAGNDSMASAGSGNLLRPALPLEVRAEYGVSRGSTRIGTVIETFRREGDRYAILSETVAAGALGWIIRDKLVVRSEGQITGTGLRPLTYSFSREKAPKKNVSATFVWQQGPSAQAGLMTSQHDGRTAQLQVASGTLDRLSILYQFMVAPPGSERVEAWMTNGKSVTRYAYERRGTETIQTPMGAYEALRIHRKDSDDGSEVDLWLAQDRHFVPLRIRLTHKDGTQDEQTLLSLSVR